MTPALPGPGFGCDDMMMYVCMCICGSVSVSVDVCPRMAYVCK